MSSLWGGHSVLPTKNVANRKRWWALKTMPTLRLMQNLVAIIRVKHEFVVGWAFFFAHQKCRESEKMVGTKNTAHPTVDAESCCYHSGIFFLLVISGMVN